MTETPTTRRSFFGLAGGAALLCTIGGEEVDRRRPRRARQGRRGGREACAARARAAAQDVPQIQPAPGGDPARVLDPGRDARAGRSRRRGATSGTTAASAAATPSPRTSTAQMTPGFAGYAIEHPTIPGPTLYAEVGDVLVVHFRNADRKLRQAVTMHPHGVKYNPEYDGAYMGEYTRAGGFIAPGRVVHLPVGVHARVGRRLAVPRPRPQPHAQHVPRPVRRDHRPPARREVRPTASYTLFAHQLPPPVTGLRAQLPLLQRPRLRRQHADADARASARTSRSTRSAWTPTSTRSTSTATAGRIRRGRSSTTRRSGPNEIRHGPLRRGQPGSLALPLPRLLASGRGDGGLVRGRPLDTRGEVMRIAASPLACWRPRCSRPPPRARRPTPSPRSPGPVAAEAQGPAQDATRSARRRPLRLHDDPEGRQQGQGRRHDPRQATAPTARP